MFSVGICFRFGLKRIASLFRINFQREFGANGFPIWQKRCSREPIRRSRPLSKNLRLFMMQFASALTGFSLLISRCRKVFKRAAHRCDRAAQGIMRHTGYYYNTGGI